MFQVKHTNVWLVVAGFIYFVFKVWKQKCHSEVCLSVLLLQEMQFPLCIIFFLHFAFLQ